MTPPFGGLSLLVSILVLLVAGLITLIRNAVAAHADMWRPARAHPIVSAVIIGLLCSFYVTAYSQVLTFAVTDPRNNFARAYYHTVHECIPLSSSESHDRKVILRLDDVQAHGWTDISITMMTDARERGMPLVAGVIPYNLGTDPRIVHFFKRYGCTVEVAIHGYKHGLGEEGARGYGEYARLSLDSALSLTRTAQSELSSVVETRAVSFIPPNNVISESAAEVVNFVGMPIISSGDRDAYGFDTGTYATTSGPRTAVDIIEECDARWALNDPLCVIMLHPQEFSDDDHELQPEKYRLYTELLELLHERDDIEITTFRDMIEEQAVPAKTTL